MYINGNGVERNYTKAKECFEKALAQGHMEAQTYLGYIYENGLGVSQDIDHALNLYSKSAESGKGT